MIYAARRKSDGMIKIGCSKYPSQRIRTLHLEMVAVWEGSFDEERRVHKLLYPSCCNKKWTRKGRPIGSREWFHPTRRVLSYIRKIGYSLEALNSGRKTAPPTNILHALELERTISYIAARRKPKQRT